MIETFQPELLPVDEDEALCRELLKAWIGETKVIIDSFIATHSDHFAAMVKVLKDARERKVG